MDEQGAQWTDGKDASTELYASHLPPFSLITMRSPHNSQRNADTSLIVHTMSELHFPGNCLKGSRPILSFDATFTTAPHLLLVKEILTHIFGVPKGARKTKPFIDHVMGFTIADGKIWIRCFQISETAVSKTEDSTLDPTVESNGTEKATHAKKAAPGETKISLVEIGPRFVLTPIVILEGSFGGPVIYENKEFVSQNIFWGLLWLGKGGR